jgi:hypothetical protein
MHSERTLVCHAELQLAHDPAGTDRREQVPLSVDDARSVEAAGHRQHADHAPPPIERQLTMQATPSRGSSRSVRSSATAIAT